MEQTMKEQVKSGIRLGIGCGSFLVAAMLLSAGMGRVVWSAVAPYHIVWREPIGWAELLAAAVILFSTADVWWQLLAGYMFVGCVKGVVVFITGRDLFSPHSAFPRLESAGLAVFAALTVALLFRFVGAQPTIVDRVALTLFVFCLVSSAATAKFSSVSLSLVVALIVLLIPLLVSWLRKNDRRRRAFHKTRANF